MTYIEEYNNWIKANPNKVNKKIKIIYNKLVDDIVNPKTISFFNELTEEEETHTYIFDENKANRPIEFIERFCKHSKGKWAGKPVILELWQKAFIQALFGFVDNETGLRKYQKSILFVARKNGKSTLAAGIGLYMLTSAGEGGAEVYSVATKKEQAKIVWEEARRMVKKSPALFKRIRTLINGLFYDNTESFFKALASDSNSLDGLNSFYVIADEIHAWKDKNLIDVMYDSMSGREEPIFSEFSTMGTVRENVFDNEYEYGSDLIETFEKTGVMKDERILFIIYELDNPKEIEKEECWYKPNPGLGTIKNVNILRDKVKTASNNPNELPNLLCKDFNIRQNDQDKWLTYEVIHNTATFSDNEIYDTYAIGGVDLSSTTDLTCATLIVIKNGIRYVKQQYFIPTQKLEYKINDDKIPYDKWEKRGLVTLCDGAKIDYCDVTQWFLKMQDDLKINTLWVGYDPWNTQYWVEEMKNYGFEMYEVRQGAKTMSNPMKQLEADLMDKIVNYNNNPILEWCLLNTSVKRDDNDNIRPVKGQKQRARIDGAVSLIIAYCVMYEKYNDYMAIVEG
jgi:phage terminase large subunit-like protein